jgi:hypothetical protein
MRMSQESCAITTDFLSIRNPSQCLTRVSDLHLSRRLAIQCDTLSRPALAFPTLYLTLPSLSLSVVHKSHEQLNWQIIGSAHFPPHAHLVFFKETEEV